MKCGFNKQHTVFNRQCRPSLFCSFLASVESQLFYKIMREKFQTMFVVRRIFADFLRN